MQAWVAAHKAVQPILARNTEPPLKVFWGSKTDKGQIINYIRPNAVNKRKQAAFKRATNASSPDPLI